MRTQLEKGGKELGEAADDELSDQSQNEIPVRDDDIATKEKYQEEAQIRFYEEESYNPLG